MRRWLVVFLLALGAAATAAVAYAAAARGRSRRARRPPRRRARLLRGRLRLQPPQPGRSDRVLQPTRQVARPTYFGNEATRANSTPQRSAPRARRPAGCAPTRPPIGLRRSSSRAGRSDRSARSSTTFGGRSSQCRPFPPTSRSSRAPRRRGRRRGRGSRTGAAADGAFGSRARSCVAARPACGSSSSSRTAGTAVGSTRRPQQSPRVLDQRRLPVDASGGSASAGAGGVLRRRRRPDR